VVNKLTTFLVIPLLILIDLVEKVKNKHSQLYHLNLLSQKQLMKKRRKRKRKDKFNNNNQLLLE
jgi:hypothetical protein